MPAVHRGIPSREPTVTISGIGVITLSIARANALPVAGDVLSFQERE